MGASTYTEATPSLDAAGAGAGAGAGSSLVRSSSYGAVEMGAADSKPRAVCSRVRVAGVACAAALLAACAHTWAAGV
jgi:hypothetical protein